MKRERKGRKRDGKGTRETIGQDGMRQDSKRKKRKGMGHNGKEKRKGGKLKGWNRTEQKRQGKEVTG